MDMALQKLSIHDGIAFHEMLQELPANENGFVNSCNGMAFDAFKQWLVKCDAMARGVGLKTWMVPQTNYWLLACGVPVGFGKLRHFLTESFRADGGHIGYAIRPSHRGMGYGKKLLALLVSEASAMGIENLLLTVQLRNEASLHVALSNGGILEHTSEDKHYIWIKGDCYENNLSP